MSLNQAEYWRLKVLLAGAALLLLVLFARLLHLQLSATQFGADYLKEQSQRRVVAYDKVSGIRGEIVDRKGRLLAHSTPTKTIGFRHNVVELGEDDFQLIADALSMSREMLESRLNSHPRFVYLQRRMDPNEADQAIERIRDELGFSANIMRSLFDIEVEYKRFYPAGEVAAHVVGFTGIEDQGQEGVELSYDQFLTGQFGKRKIVRNGKRQIVGETRLLEPAQPGERVSLTIDLQLQSVAHKELKAVVAEHGAKSGSMAILDVASGDILALVSQPSYNVNDRSEYTADRARNRALLDVFEPGSTVKPFTFAAGLELERFNFGSRVDTSPGFIRIDGYPVFDPTNYRELSAADVLVKSSQVGTAKLALQLEGEELRDLLQKVGFGEFCAVGFPGEQTGYLPSYRRWADSHKATLGYGYSLEVNVLQLARAYVVLAADGVRRPVRLIKGVGDLSADANNGFSDDYEQVVSSNVARELRAVMRQVVERGTGRNAQVPGYSVAGKTGTVHKADSGSYLESAYRATFAGMLPADEPKLVAVITVEEPGGKQYYGGEVAAPAFARVMGQAARILGIPPDQINAKEVSAHSEQTNDLLASAKNMTGGLEG